MEKTVEDVEKTVEDVEKTVKDVEKTVEAEVKTVVENILNEGSISEEMKDSLDNVDPWMANKMKQ